MPVDYRTMDHVGWTRWLYCKRCRPMICTHHGSCFLHAGLFSRYYWRPCICWCSCKSRPLRRNHTRSLRSVMEMTQANRAKLTYLDSKAGPAFPSKTAANVSYSPPLNKYAYLTDDELVMGVDPDTISDLLKRKRH